MGLSMFRRTVVGESTAHLTAAPIDFFLGENVTARLDAQTRRPEADDVVTRKYQAGETSQIIPHEGLEK